VNRDSGWRVVAEGHGIMAAVLGHDLIDAIQSWHALIEPLGYSRDEVAAWQSVIANAFQAKACDLRVSETEPTRDPILQLAKLVKDAGLTMTLYGHPVDEQQLRSAAKASGLARVVGEDPEQAALAVIGRQGTRP
jgi:hypothetical protein